MKPLSMSLFVFGLVLYFVVPGFAMGVTPQPTPAAFTSTLVAKAEVDECFNGVGNAYKPGPASNCSSGERQKANQSYLWGLTKSGDNLWFGTAPNMLCMVHAFASYESGAYDPQPYQGNLWTCEYEKGQYLESSEMAGLNVPEKFNDYRPPKIYTYNETSGALTDRSATITDTNARYLLMSTFGLRSAATYGDFVILSGPRALGAGINVFLFQGSTGAFLGATTLTAYQNIRKWLVYNNVLYAAVSKESGGGAVIRYTGTTANPFSFTEVGVLDGSGAEIVVHNNRIFVGTWPDRTGDTGAMAGIYMSPTVPSGGLTASDANSWTKVWQADDYEPDPFGATIYGTGAMASFGGYLYWGTMHVQGRAALAFIDRYNIPESGYYDAYFNSWRATAVFRCSNFDTSSSPSVQLLYGDSSLPVYSNGRWYSARNNMGGVSGTYGASGFGNDYNNYTWTMAVYQDQLWVGTMDHSYLWTDFQNLQNIYLHGTYIYIPWWWQPDTSEFGADIWRFPSTSSAAVRFTRNGLGNYTNYGFRTVLVDDTGLYYGTANPANIAQWDNGSLKGGWELWRVSDSSSSSSSSSTSSTSSTSSSSSSGGDVTTTLQAENATIVTGVMESEHSGYTGTGYANTDNATGNYIEFSLTASQAGSYDLTFRYALLSGNRYASILVNGSTAVSNIDFNGTGAWTTWGTTSATVNLNAGNNTIRLRAQQSGGLANIDKMDVYGYAVN